MSKTELIGTPICMARCRSTLTNSCGTLARNSVNAKVMLGSPRVAAISAFAWFSNSTVPRSPRSSIVSLRRNSIGTFFSRTGSHWG